MMEDGKDGIREYGNDGVMKDRNIGVGGRWMPYTLSAREAGDDSKRVDRIGEFL